MDTKARENDRQTHITIKVQGIKQNEIFFRIRKDAALREAMRIYCDKLGLEYETVRFIYDGTRVKSLHTPNDLKMNDGDVIDAFIDQYRGGRGRGRGRGRGLGVTACY